MVISSISYSLPSGVENLALASGAGNINGTGNALDNVIIGNQGNNILNGKGGNDTLTGGGGADTSVFQPGFGHSTVTDFGPGQDILQVDHLIFADVATLLAHTADDIHGNAVITADVQNSITMQNVTTSVLHQQHSSDFHIV